MSNKWRTSIGEANAVLEKYSVDVSNPSSEVLLRRFNGIARTYLESARTALKASTTITDPKVDGITFEGTWVVGEVYFDPATSGNIAGSTSILQELKPGYSYCTPDNETVVRSRAYPLEQNENAWMYYERFKLEETRRWHNILPSLAPDLLDSLRQMFNFWGWVDIDGVPTVYDCAWGLVYSHITGAAYQEHLVAGGDLIIGASGARYHDRQYLNMIYRKDDGKFYKRDTASYGGKTISFATAPFSRSVTDWWAGSEVEIENPVIRECWMEINKDGTYDIYRTIETTTTTAIMRTRALQYAGMTRISGLPALDDTTLAIIGFLDTDETIHENARFRIGSDTYRVLSDAQVSGGSVTVSVTPAVTLATETAADDNPEQTQVYWDAL